MTFREDIQGLRALAVLSVVIYHISPHHLPGGFVGVDMFFVISGYLIMGQIYNKIQQGAFSISNFYVKRFKRLFPAFFATVSVTSFFAFSYFTTRFPSATYLVAIGRRTVLCIHASDYDSCVWCV